MKSYYKDRDELRDKIIAMRKELNELTKQWHEMYADEEEGWMNCGFELDIYNERVYDEESEE